MYDVIVVGARCAGSPTAMLLAKAGLRVLLVDRDTFPSDALSTAYMQADAVIRMERWGLLDRLIAAGTPAIRAMRVAMGPLEMTSPTDPPGYAPRRTVLDTILVAAAREAGVEVREGCSVQEVLLDDAGAVRGVRVQQDGVVSEETARMVIGADGRNSVVARAVAPPEYHYHEGTTSGYYSFFKGDFDLHTGRLTMRGNHAMFVFPTNDSSVCIAFEGKAENFERMRQDPTAYMLEKFGEHVPDVAASLRTAEQTDRWFGFTRRPSFYRKPYGPGWALVGDAGYLKDPILGDGINDAFRDAELVADAVTAGLRGETPLEHGLAQYEATRNAASAARYELNVELCQFAEITQEQLIRFGQANAAVGQKAGAN